MTVLTKITLGNVASMAGIVSVFNSAAPKGVTVRNMYLHRLPDTLKYRIVVEWRRGEDPRDKGSFSVPATRLREAEAFEFDQDLILSKLRLLA